MLCSIGIVTQSPPTTAGASVRCASGEPMSAVAQHPDRNRKWPPRLHELKRTSATADDGYVAPAFNSLKGVRKQSAYRE